VCRVWGVDEFCGGSPTGGAVSLLSLWSGAVRRVLRFLRVVAYALVYVVGGTAYRLVWERPKTEAEMMAELEHASDDYIRAADAWLAAHPKE